MGDSILLVDDVPDFLRDAARALRRAGHRVIAVPTTSAALDRLDAGLTIDLLITRVRMPPGHPHGLALARMVKHRHPDVRVLIHAIALDDLPAAERADPPGVLIGRPARGADLARAAAAALGDTPDAVPAPPRTRRQGAG